MDNSIVTPKAGVTPAEPNPPAAAPEEAPAPQAEAKTLPKDLMRIPAMQGLVAGSPAAISAPLAEFAKRGEAKTIAEHKDLLMKAGMGFYRSLDGQTGIIFNQFYVHGDALKQADAAGQLSQIAPPFDAVDHALSKAGLMHPALSHPGVPPAAPAAPPVMAPPQMAQAPAPQANEPPMPASAQRKLATARVSNLQPGSPTSGGSPGAGRLLNSILKPVL